MALRVDMQTAQQGIGSLIVHALEMISRHESTLLFGQKAWPIASEDHTLEGPDRGSGARWKGAIAALETDPDAELPSE